jgi:hypothetical protein
MAKLTKTTGGIALSDAAGVKAREDEGQVVHLRDEAGEPAYFGPDEDRKPVTVRIAGTYSALYRRTLQLQKDRVLKRRLDTLSAEEMDRKQIELVAACILGWEGLVATPDAPPLPFTRENAVQLLTQATWIYDQVDAAMRDHAGFFSPPSAS